MSPNPKLSLNIGEENELGFELSIEGKTSDVNSSDPKVRFVLEESDSKRAWIFPSERQKGGQVSVTLPSDEDLFKEDKDYTGHLEVILGNHFFVPASVDIEFVRPLKVEASVVNKKGNKEEKTLNEESSSISVSNVEVKSTKKPSAKESQDTFKEVREISEADESDENYKDEDEVKTLRQNLNLSEKNSTKIKNSPNKEKQKNKSSKKTKRSWDSLTEEQKRKVISKLKEQKLQSLKNKRKQNAKVQQQQKKKAENQLKDRLKNLMASSLLDD